MCYIHCDLLNKDDNLFNGEKSDILANFLLMSPGKNVFYKFGGIYKNLKSSDFTSIRLTLRDQKHNLLSLGGIVYELEFVK